MQTSYSKKFKPSGTTPPDAREEAREGPEEVKPMRPCLEIHSARHHWVEFSLPCTIEAADQVNEFLVWFFAELHEDVRESVMLVLRELMLNAIEWGGKSDETKRVRISILHGKRAVVCRVSDPGNGFRLEKLSHAAICNPEGQPCCHMFVREKLGLRPGGFGLEIVHSKVDELIYNDAGNEVVFMKYTDLPADNPPATASFCPPQ